MDDFPFEEDGEEDHIRKKKIKPLDSYKVCEGCEHILFNSVIICPFCKSYRFSHDKQRVFAAYEYFREHYEEMIDWEMDQY